MGERKRSGVRLGVGRRDKIERMYTKGILYKPVRACFPPLSTYAGGDGNVRDREREILRRRTGWQLEFFIEDSCRPWKSEEIEQPPLHTGSHIYYLLVLVPVQTWFWATTYNR
ncbi:hypothetical protein Bbelb_278780 [Branchiostoma belcheri]|nr:hypothetical protein Bbelb_278780 [Branchiostoma belcheri]